jgi:pimeloyl-ACP methyl ester carboxylesterase
VNAVEPAANRRRTAAKRAGLVSALVGVAAAGVAAGVATERLLLRRSRRTDTQDPHAEEQFGQLPYDECLTVRTSDGIDLYVEVVEPNDGIDVDFDYLDLPHSTSTDPTLVFVHGFALDMGTFYFQRSALTRRGDCRMVFYDQPGHGRSGRLDTGEYNLDDLAEGLKRVIDETTPTGPIVLIGHSMGGMTIMAMADAYPELFLDRVAGVVFISTSAGELAQVSLGMPDFVTRFTRPLLPVLIGSGRLTSGVVDSVRRASTDLAWLLTRRYGFGSAPASRALVSFVEQMNSRTSTEVLLRYLRTVYTHERIAALDELKRTKVLVICGDDDKLTPPSHSEEIVRHLPDARFVAVPEAGHVALLERPDIVNAALLEFLEGV